MDDEIDELPKPNSSPKGGAFSYNSGPRRAPQELGEQGWMDKRGERGGATGTPRGDGEQRNRVDLTLDMDRTEDEMIVHDTEAVPYSRRSK